MATNYSLDSLIADLKKNTYTPKTDAELQEAAKNRYQSAYDQKRLETQHAADTTQQALDRQLSSLGAASAKQKELSGQQYAQAYSQADRQALSRGMQRSSFNNATLGNIAVAGNKAQQEIADAETTARTGLEDQKTLLARQLAEQLKQYSAAQAADTLSYLDQLEQQEYDRSTAATDQQNSLAAQIYQFANQAQQQNTANDQWLKQFNEQIRQYDASAAQNQAQFDTLHPASRSSGTGNKGSNNNKGNNIAGNIGPTDKDLLGTPPYNQKTLDSWAKMPIGLPTYGSVKTPLALATSGLKKARN